MELLLLLFICAEAGITGNASMIWAVLHQALYPYYTWHSFQMFQSNYKQRTHTMCEQGTQMASTESNVYFIKSENQVFQNMQTLHQISF